MAALMKEKIDERKALMKAVRVHEFGGLDALVYEDVPRPTPGEGQVLVRVSAAGVGPWDALIRSGGSKLGQPLPLTLGSDLCGVIEAAGPTPSAFQIGDAVFGITNALFTGADAEYAVADVDKIAPKPPRLNDAEAASVPVVAVTAWQMVFDFGKVDDTKHVLVQGAGGNVGAYAVQLAKWAGAAVSATAFTKDIGYIQALGADHVMDVSKGRFEDHIKGVDVVVDTIGGETLDRSFAVLKPGGRLVSAVSLPDQDKAARLGVQGVFFYVTVTSARLNELAGLIQSAQILPTVGEVLPLADARRAHEMLAGKLHKRGKIILKVEGTR